MDEANNSPVDMDELMHKAGSRIAELLEVPAAHVTSGTCAALALAAAGCIAGDDLEKAEALPTVTDSRRNILIQEAHRYRYARCVDGAGARLREVGSSDATTHPSDLAAAFTADAVAILFPMLLDGLPGTVGLEETRALARAHGVPLILDAAGTVYPIDRMKMCARSGDLVCFGAKYFGGPGTTGILAGRKDLVACAALQDFMSFERGIGTFGRAMKVDRQGVVGTVAALSEWIELDHVARLQEVDRRMTVIADAVVDGGAVSMTTTEGDLLHVHLKGNYGRSAREIASALRAGTPSILVRVQDGQLVLSMSALRDGDDQIIASRLAALL
jgi:L-seryl-tRNA(Ser) seleniumtransferase